MITGYSAKHVADGFSVFIWSDSQGYEKSLKIINNLKASPSGVRSYLEQKFSYIRATKSVGL